MFLWAAATTAEAVPDVDVGFFTVVVALLFLVSTAWRLAVILPLQLALVVRLPPPPPWNNRDPIKKVIFVRESKYYRLSSSLIKIIIK